MFREEAHEEHFVSCRNPVLANFGIKSELVGCNQHVIQRGGCTQQGYRDFFRRMLMPGVGWKLHEHGRIVRPMYAHKQRAVFPTKGYDVSGRHQVAEENAFASNRRRPGSGNSS